MVAFEKNEKDAPICDVSRAEKLREALALLESGVVGERMGQYSFQELENSPALCTKDEFRRNIKSYLHQGQRTQLLSQEGGVAELGFNLNYGILHSLREERRC